MRFRIRTIMIAVTILALIAALAVQTWRAERREAVLRARMQTMAE
jgi:type II secretory pathway pseudopilin PulG